MRAADKLAKVLVDQGFETTPGKIWVTSITGSVTETVTQDGVKWNHRDTHTGVETKGEGHVSLEAHLVATAP